MSPSAAIPEGSVVITPTEMYREMQATHQAVRDVSTKLDGALDAYGRRLDGLDKDVGDHEERIRHGEQTYATKADVKAVETAVNSLQRWRWRSVGITSGISVALASGATAGILQAFAGKH